MIINKKVHTFCVEDVFQYFDKWSKKAYLDSPLLVKGDRPIVENRKWTKQFN